MIQKLKHSTVFKVFSLNSISIFLKMILGFVTVKLYANFVGPSGFAFLGNFKNITAVCKQLSTLGYDNGIVALVSENKENKNKLSEICSTSFFSRLIFSTTISVLLLLFKNQLTNFLSTENISVNFAIILFAAFLPFYSINTLFLSYLNGLGKFKKVIIANILASFIGFVLTCYFIYNYKLAGGLISLAINESVVIIPTLFFLRKLHLFIRLKNVKKIILKNLTKFSLMTLSTVLIVNVSHFVIRELISSHLSTTIAGYWDAMIRFSDYYMMIVSSSLTLYYLPKFAEIHSKKELLKEIKKYIAIASPLSLLFFSLIYFLREPIILIVFNRDFIGVSDFFSYYLMGDFLKMISMIFGYRILAKGMVSKYLFIELSYYISYVLGTYLLLYFNFKSEAVSISYLLANMVSLAVMLLIYKLSILPNS